MRLYDPLKSPCWTGMLPNLFLKVPGVIRTVYPYNSLAAIGPEAHKMFENNHQQIYVYDENSAWSYCVKKHAKILFVGTTSNRANTIQSHMIADIMQDDWPIKEWYQVIQCSIRDKGIIYDKNIMVQKDEWTQYIADYHITYKLKKRGLLFGATVNGCPLEWIEDSNEMVTFLVDLCKQGDMSYLVPKKYKK